MGWRKSLPAVLLITLAVPPAQGRTGRAGETGATNSVASQNDSTARSSSPAQSLAIKRRSKSQEPAEFSADTVALVQKYLQSRTSGASNSANAQAGWDRFYLCCDQNIRRFAQTFRRRGVDVDECAQQVWVDLLRNLPTFQMDSSRGRFSSWLYTIVRNKAMDMLRQQSRKPATALALADDNQLIAGDSDPTHRIQQRQQIQEVRDAMAQLRQQASEKSYRVLHLRHIDGKSVREVADELGLTSQQVWVREHRMKNKLRDLLAQRQSEQPAQKLIA